MELRQKLIEIAKRYTETVSDEFLKEIQEEVKFNAYISGSVSYGYCDEMSDIEMEFYLPKNKKEAYKEKLNKIIESHKEFEGIRMSAGVSDWPLEMIVNGDMDEFWKQSYTYLLYELIHTFPVREDIPLLDDVKKKIDFYPEKTLLRIIKGLWLTIADNGTYNANWSFKRGQFVSSNMFLYMSLEAIFRLAYLLNKKYFPHTKWLEKEIDSLKHDFGIKEFIANFDKMNLEQKLESHNEIVKKMDIFMTDNAILREELINNPWEIVHEDYYVFNPMRFGWDELKHD